MELLQGSTHFHENQRLDRFRSNHGVFLHRDLSFPSGGSIPPDDRRTLHIVACFYHLSDGDQSDADRVADLTVL